MCELLAALQVLHKHEGFVGGFGFHKFVVVVLDGSHHEVDVAVLHVHPGDVAFVVVIGFKGFLAGLEVIFHFGVVGDGDGFFQQIAHLSDFLLVFLMIPAGDEPALVVAADDSIKAFLVGVLAGGEFFF